MPSYLLWALGTFLFVIVGYGLLVRRARRDMAIGEELSRKRIAEAERRKREQEEATRKEQALKEEEVKEEERKRNVAEAKAHAEAIEKKRREEMDLARGQEEKARIEEEERNRLETERLRLEAEAKALSETQELKRREQEDLVREEAMKGRKEAERISLEEERAINRTGTNPAAEEGERKPERPLISSELEGETRENGPQKRTMLSDLEGLPDRPIGYVPVDPQGLYWPKDDYPIVEIPLPDSTVKGTRIGKPGSRGVSENSFFHVLQQHYPGNLLRDHRVEFTGASRDYEPDIILHFDDQVLRIDIEIDEPYGLTTRKPMHWIGSYDDDRDLYFGNHGWVVVRFAEIQVVKQPAECVAFIAQLVSTLTKKQPSSSASPEMNMLRTARWTYEQAKKWAATGYRESYLGIAAPTVVEGDEEELVEIEVDLEREPDQDHGRHRLRDTGLATLTPQQQANKDHIQQLIDQGAHARMTGAFGERLLKPKAIVKRRARHLVQAYDEVLCADLEVDLRKISDVTHEPEPFRLSGRLEDLDFIALQSLSHKVMGREALYLQINY